MKLYIVLISLVCCTSCITYKKKVDLNDLPVAVGNNLTTKLLEAIDDDSISVNGRVGINPFTYKKETTEKGKPVTYFVENRSLADFSYEVENLRLNTKRRGDSIFVSPGGSTSEIRFELPLVVQRNSVRGKLKRIKIQSDNTAILKLRLNPFGFLKKHARALEGEDKFPIENIKQVSSSLDQDMIGLAYDLDRELTQLGDIIPGPGLRAYFVGPTSFLSAAEDRFVLQTRVRAELWKKLPIGDTKLWSRTKAVKIEIGITIPEVGSPYLQVITADISGFPGDFEQVLVRTVNKKLKQQTFRLSLFGRETILNDISFSFIDDHSINVKVHADFVHE